MELILDGNLKHVVHVYGKQISLKNKTKWGLLTIQINALNRSNYQFDSSHAHLFLSYHLI